MASEWDQFENASATAVADPFAAFPADLKGQISAGNIDLASRPVVKNADGSISTVRSLSVGMDGKEVLIPTVSEDGRILPNEEAIQQYKTTGKHLGIFDTPDNATAYARQLHESQALKYVPALNHSEQWNQNQSDMLARATSAGIPITQDARKRLIDAIGRMETAGFKTPHFIGTQDEPTGDRGVTRDIENLVANGMSADQWRQQTGDPEPLYPGEQGQPMPSAVPGPGNVPNTPADTRLSSILGKLLSLPAKGVLGTTNAALATLTGDIFQNPDAYQPTEADIQQPLVSGETVGKGLTAALTGGRATQLKETGGLSGALKGIIEGTGNAVSSATTPENLALIPTLAGVGGKAAARVIAGVFEGQALAGTPEQWKSFNEAKTLSEKFRIGTEMGLGLAIPAAGFAHTFAKEAPKISAETTTPEGVTSTSEAQIKASEKGQEATNSGVLAAVAPSVPSAAEPAAVSGLSEAQAAPVQATGRNTVIDKSVREQFRDASGAIDQPAATQHITQQVKDALARGDTVTLVADFGRKKVPILDATDRGLLDAQRQPWGTFDILTGGSQVEITPKTGTVTRVVGPALIDTEGNIIEQGKLGETHQDLLKRAMAGDMSAQTAALAAFENDSQHVFVDSTGKVLSREEAAPVAVTAGQAPEGTTKIQSQMLKAEPAPVEPTSPESTTGIAQRVNEARTEAGRTGEILPGEGVTAEEMVVRGRELLQKGANPEAIITGVSEGKAVTGDEMAVLRARREELSRISDQAADDARKNPNNPELKQAAEDAFKAETDFAQRIKPAATEWHKVGEAMQGETDVQTGTFTGLRRAFRERTGRDVTATEAVTLEKTADRVQKANAEVDKVKSDFAEVVKNETKTTLPRSAEELRAHFAERLKNLLPC